ncbi:MAG: type III PLP-dependent enzyme [Chitinispirillaceae bacterium]|jgi:ornithine decarboxylase|nr:type III PLP-dependent enzyme [Chitinispirillaceae bacterium]
MEFSTVQQLAGIHGTPTLFLSEGRLRESYRELRAALPGVDLYYAVKSNATPEIINILKREECLFDVCTNGEIDLVRAAGITAADCLHTHPIKRDGDIRYALDYGIDTFVIDNEDEIGKLVPYKNKLQVLVRMSIQNPNCLVNLSHKFGIAPELTFDLIEKAAKAGLTIKGICFHCGSQNENSLKYLEALEYCRDICRKAALKGISIKVIDIGGGFPINYLTPVQALAEFCSPVNEYLERYFSNYRIIAEPGRVLSGPSMTLATRVIGRSLRSGVWWYYCDEGVYGSFSGKIYDHADYPMFIERPGLRYNSVLAGPTCDSIDVTYEHIALPLLEIGDLLVFESMGAYTTASASNFNGFPKAKIVVVE